MIYNLFISHSWSYTDSYEKLLYLLDSNPYFRYKNYSVPKSDPIHNTNNESQLKLAIKDQMKHASCVVILAGVYSSYSKWINIEIELAKSMNKKIIAIEPWGAQRTSAVVKNESNTTAKWNTDSIIKAIRGY